MACGGPNKDHAHKQADEAYDEGMKLLEEKYDIRADAISTFGGFRQDFTQAQLNLREALREVFWSEACGTW